MNHFNDNNNNNNNNFGNNQNNQNNQNNENLVNQEDVHNDVNNNNYIPPGEWVGLPDENGITADEEFYTPTLTPLAPINTFYSRLIRRMNE
jgi:hypothetical protein